MTSADYSFNVVLSQGDNAHQSVDVTGINRDIYLEITSTTNKYTVADITDQFAYVRGDVNRDGELSVADVTTLIDILVSGDYDDELIQIGDLNNDLELSVADVTTLIDILIS